MSRATAVVAAALRAPVAATTWRATGYTLLSLVLAACGGDKGSEGDDKPQSQPVEGGKQLAAVWPLTGEPVLEPHLQQITHVPGD